MSVAVGAISIVVICFALMLLTSKGYEDKTETILDVIVLLTVILLLCSGLSSK